MSFPGVEGLRPTPDRVRETVFNWLSPYLPGARVLDLYAGSGILGFEALSRGASSVVAVETNRRVADRLRESARELEADGLEVVVMDVMGFLRITRPAFDVIFADPPHADTDYESLFAALDRSGLAAPAAFAYFEFSTSRSSAFSAPAGWIGHRTARAGHLTFQLWRRVERPGSGAV